MAKSVQDVLILALDDLAERSFKRFCNKLLDYNKDLEKKISKSQLEKADRVDVVGLIQDAYEDYGVTLTVDILEAINENRVASDLKKNLEKVKQASSSNKPKKEPQSTSEASSSSAPKPQVVTFVDKYREELIDRWPLVAPVLDGLKTKDLLNSEMYDTILAEKTPQNQMRKLYRHIEGFSETDKHTLYEILKKKNGPLVRNLENS